MYTAVHGHVQTVYTAVYGPCTRSVHDPNTVNMNPNTVVYTAVFTAVYTVVHGMYGPCTPRYNAYQASQKLTTETCWTSNPIIRSLKIDLFTFYVSVTFWVTM